MPDGDAPSPTVSGTQPAAASAAPSGTPPWLLAVGLLSLSAGVAWLLLGGGDPFVYSETVAELSASPEQFAGRTLRVEGALTEGSVRFRDEPCEWRFSLEEDGHVVPVEFHECIVPDTFRDHMGITVVVQGELQPGGTFLASEVIPRCPSRYEMDERAGRGESMPHASPIREAPPPPET